MASFALVLLTAAQGAELSTSTQECMGGWPLFQTQEDLDADHWGSYFATLYWRSTVTKQFKYPFCVGSLWQFYDDVEPQKKIPDVSGTCPSHGAPEGQRYKTNDDYQPAHTSFSWHAPPYSARRANAWVEVSHQKDPFGDEHYGMWLLWAPGSSIWFNTGKTIAFNDHGDVCNTINCPHGNGNEAFCQAAAAEGYDSIQFTKHHDHVNYPCDQQAGVLYMGLEIVAVKLTGTYACGSADPGKSLYHTMRGGWHNSICDCDNSRPVLNCGRRTPDLLRNTTRFNQSVAEVGGAHAVLV